MKIDHLTALNQARRNRQAIILTTEVETGNAAIVREKDSWQDHALADEFAVRFRSGKSGVVTAPDGGQVFLKVQVPSPRLVVVGAVHISQAMAPISILADFEMIVVDPRTAFATPERFPNVALHAQWPEDVLPGLHLDPYTGFAALTHDPKIDDWAIAHALKSECFYVGALGSRKTHAKRIERLTATGLAASVMDRIDAPIGADIGAASPAEIAIAIFANVIAALRKRSDAAPKQHSSEEAAA